MGLISSDDVVAELRDKFGTSQYQDRVEYAKRCYTYDNMVTGKIFNKRTGEPSLGSNIYVGGDSSPVPHARIIWFLVVGDDPLQVRWAKDGRLYAIYNKGEERVYMHDAVSEDRKHLLPAGHLLKRKLRG